MSPDQKRNYWPTQIGRQVSAKNYRGVTASGMLLAVVPGVWGYGGDSVALELDVSDDRGLCHWPAALCVVVESQEKDTRHDPAHA